MNQLIGINDWYLFPKVARSLVFERVVKPLVYGGLSDDAVAKPASPWPNLISLRSLASPATIRSLLE